MHDSLRDLVSNIAPLLHRHYIICHLVKTLRLHGSLSRYSQEAYEQLNALFRFLYNRETAKDGGMLAKKDAACSLQQIMFAITLKMVFGLKYQRKKDLTQAHHDSPFQRRDAGHCKNVSGKTTVALTTDDDEVLPAGITLIVGKKVQQEGVKVYKCMCTDQPGVKRKVYVPVQEAAADVAARRMGTTLNTSSVARSIFLNHAQEEFKTMVPAHKQRVYASKYKLPEDERDGTPVGRCGWCNVPKIASVEPHWHGSYCEGCYSSCVAPYRTGGGPASLATDEPESSTPEDFECLLPAGVCDDWRCSQLDDDSGGDEPGQGGGVLLLSPAVQHREGGGAELGSGRVGKVTNKKKKVEDLEKNKQKRKKSKAKSKTVQAFDPHADIDLSDEDSEEEIVNQHSTKSRARKK